VRVRNQRRELRTRRPRGFTSTDYFVFGTPDEVVEFVDGFTAGAPVDTLYFWAALPGMTNDQILRNIRLIGEEVAPRLRERAAVAPAPS